MLFSDFIDIEIQDGIFFSILSVLEYSTNLPDGISLFVWNFHLNMIILSIRT